MTHKKDLSPSQPRRLFLTYAVVKVIEKPANLPDAHRLSLKVPSPRGGDLK